MYKVLNIVLMVLLTSSCSTFDKFKTKEKAVFQDVLPEVSNRELWLNRNSDELVLHPIFASLPLERRKTSQGIEVFSFQNSGGTQEYKSCNLSTYYYSYVKSSSSEGSCNTTKLEVKCSHVFYVSNNKVTDYKKVGQCSDDRIDFRPYDQKGIPVMTDAEKTYWDKLIKFNLAENPICKKTSDCPGGKSCEEGLCRDTGILGHFITE
ncbi:MAG: hypothetical protein Q7U04_08540 [Bacteriovorax sp.]|nr:hypothetical protein [Bacteriovorax sp.]